MLLNILIIDYNEQYMETKRQLNPERNNIVECINCISYTKFIYYSIVLLLYERVNVGMMICLI